MRQDTFVQLGLCDAEEADSCVISLKLTAASAERAARPCAAHGRNVRGGVECTIQMALHGDAAIIMNAAWSLHLRSRLFLGPKSPRSKIGRCSNTSEIVDEYKTDTPATAVDV